MSCVAAAIFSNATSHSSCKASPTVTKVAIATCSYRCRCAWFKMAFQRKNPAAIGSKASYPGFVEPALASSIERVPTGDRWVHEIKFDGYRVQVHLANESIRVFTRRGNDWTKRFKKIADDAWHISAGSAIIDGEIVVPAADGTTDFSVLQNELKGRSTKIVMVAFDLLYLNGYDLRKLPLFQRKELLKADCRHRNPIQRELRGRRQGAVPARLQYRPRGRCFEGARQQIPRRPIERLGQENLRATRDAYHRRICARRQQVGWPLHRPAQGQRPSVRR